MFVPSCTRMPELRNSNAIRSQVFGSLSGLNFSASRSLSAGKRFRPPFATCIYRSLNEDRISADQLPLPSLCHWSNQGVDFHIPLTLGRCSLVMRRLQPQKRISKQQISAADVLRFNGGFGLHQRIAEHCAAILEERLHQAPVETRLRLGICQGGR